METELIIKSIMGLVAILVFLVLLLYFIPSEKEETQEEEKEKQQAKKDSLTEELPTDLESLKIIIQDKKSSTQILAKALDLIIEYHGTVHTKLGLRAHPDFDIYAEILFSLCGHKNADKTIVVKFDKALGDLNPDYKEDINEAMTKGLNSRRV